MNKLQPNIISEIKARVLESTVEMRFFESMGGQLVANWPNRLWDDPERCQADIVFHNHARADMLSLLIHINELQDALDHQEQPNMPRIPSFDELNDQMLDGQFYQKAVSEINAQLKSALGKQGYGVCFLNSDTPMIVIDRLRSEYTAKKWRLEFTDSGREGIKVDIFPANQ